MDQHIEENDGLDIGRLLFIIWRHLWILLVSIAVCTTIAILYRPMLEEHYKTNFIVFETSNVKMVEDGADNPKSIDNTNAFWLEVMESSLFHGLIQQDLDLDLTAEEINSYITASAVDGDEKYYSIDLSVKDTSIILPLYESFMYAINTIDHQHEVKFYQDRLNYLNERLINNKTQITSIDNELRSELSGFVSEKIETIDDYNLATKNFKNDLNSALVELASVNASIDIIRTEITSVRDTLMEESTFSEPLKVQLMNLYVGLAKAQTRYGTDHPIVLGIEENIIQVQSMIDDGINQSVEIKNIISNPTKTRLFAQNIDLKIQKHSLEAKIKALNTLLSQSGSQNQENKVYKLLKEKDPLIATNNFIEKKLMDLELNMSSIPRRFICIDKPTLPMSTDQKPLYFFIAIGVLLGIIGGIGTIFLHDIMTSKIKIVQDFTNACNFPLLGIVPKIKNFNNEILIKKEKHTKDEMTIDNAYMRIAINIRQLIDASKGNIITVFSAIRNDGKTSSTILLAQKIASANKKVLLIDFDVFIPRLSKHHNLEKKAGVQNYLFENDINIENAIYQTSTKNLHIMPKGQNEYNANLYLESTKIDTLLEELKSQYDYIIIDTPALNPKPQVFYLLKKSDYNLFVARIDNVTKRDIKAVEETIKSLKTPIGAILTNVVNDPFSRNNYYSSYYNYYY